MSDTGTKTSSPPREDESLSLAREGLGRWLRRKGLPLHDAEDLAQAACLRALQSREGARQGTSLLPWLVTIARRLLIDRARRAGRTAPIRPPREGEAPAETAARREEIVRLHDAVARLDEEPRRLVELFYGEGLGTEEIGQRLGLPRGTVKSRLHRARRQLAATLHGSGDPS